MYEYFESILNMRSPNYVIAILKILRGGGAMSIADIARHLLADDRPYRLRLSFPRVDGLGDLIRRIRPAIDDLVELNVISHHGEDRFSISAIPPNAPGAGGGGDEDAPGGSGLMEVLEHNILFTYSEEDFADALARALRRY